MTAFNEGFDAFNSKKALVDNPYTGNEEFKAWKNTQTQVGKRASYVYPKEFVF